MSFGRKGKSPGWRSNDHWAVCDRCGFDYRNSELKQEWTGAIVCKYCYEPRHPQDLIRAVKDDIAPVGLHRSEPSDAFTSVNHCINNNAESGVAITGCAQAGSSIPVLEDEGVPSGTFDNSL